MGGHTVSTAGSAVGLSYISIPQSPSSQGEENACGSRAPMGAGVGCSTNGT